MVVVVIEQHVCHAVNQASFHQMNGFTWQQTSETAPGALLCTAGESHRSHWPQVSLLYDVNDVNESSSFICAFSGSLVTCLKSHILSLLNANSILLQSHWWTAEVVMNSVKMWYMNYIQNAIYKQWFAIRTMFICLIYCLLDRTIHIVDRQTDG